MRNLLQGSQTSSLISSESESMKTIRSSSSEGGHLPPAKIDLDLAAVQPEHKGGRTWDEEKITIEAQAKSNRSHVDGGASQSSREARGIKEPESKEQESVVKRATFSESNLSELRKARKASLQVMLREREEVKKSHQDLRRRRSEMDISDRSRGLSAGNVGGQGSNVNPSERALLPDEIDMNMGTSRVERKPKDGRQQEQRGEGGEAKGERRLSEGAKMQAQQWWRARVKSIAKMDDDDEDL